MVMKVGLWAEIRRLYEIERLSQAAIARQLGCCHKTVSKALKMAEPPSQIVTSGASKLDPFKPQIDQLIDLIFNLQDPVMFSFGMLNELLSAFGHRLVVFRYLSQL